MSRIKIAYWPLLLLALWSCRKDVENFLPYAPSAQELSSILAERVPNALTQSKFEFNNLSADQILETPNGSRIFLIDTDNLFAGAGSGLPVQCSTCGDLKIEVTEVFDKKDILARGLNTVSVGGMLFESGGMIKITVSCNGQPLTLLPNRSLKIQLPNNDPITGYFIFNQTTSGNTEQQAWLNSGQEVFEAEWPVAGGSTQNGYELLVRELGWAACGKLITEQSSSFCIELPAGFADQNTLAYIVFKNQEVVAPLEFDLAENQFCYPNAPAGYQVQLVTVSKLGGQYWLGNSQTEIGTNAIVPLDAKQMTEDAVVNFVKGL